MANKFTKSVLERQAKELKTHPAAPPAQAVPPISHPEPEPAAPERAQEQKPPVQPPVEPARQKTASPKPAPARHTPDLADFIVRDEGRSAKNKTFYLDAAVIDALHRAAVAQKVTDSKLVNDILKKILGV